MKKKSVKIIKTVISLVLSFININLAASLEPWTKTCGKITLVLFYGIGFVLCFLLTVYLLLQSKRRLKIHSLLWGIPLAAAYVLGCLMRRDGTALGSLSHLPVLLLQILCLAVLAGACIALLLWGFLKPECWLTQLRSYFTCWYDAGNQAGSGTSADIAAQGHKDQSVSHLKNITQNIRPERPAWQTWLFSTVTILLCWLPVFLAYYPSVFAYDAEGQLYQVLAHDYSTHHPLLHTIFLGAFFRLGDVLPGSYPAGMAVHSIVQMLLMATVFGYTLARLASSNVPAALRIMLLLFYALFPTNSVLALSTTKDVLFSALVLLCTLLVYEMADSSGNGLTRKGWSLYTFWTILLLLFRNLLKLPDEWFCLFQLYKRNGSLRSRSDKIFALYRRTCSDGYHLAPVPVRIRSRKLCPSFFQEAVDLFRRISAPIEKSLRRRSALICLIPETDHPGPALCSPKHRTLQRDTGIQESHDHPVAFKLQRRLILDLQNPRLLQALCIHLCVTVGNGIISDGNILRIPKDLVPVHIKDTEIPVDILCTYAERVLFLSCEPNVNLPYKIHVVI